MILILYSCTVNVNGFPDRFSKRFGVLISRIVVIASERADIMMRVKKTPDKIGAVVKPTQS